LEPQVEQPVQMLFDSQMQLKDEDEDKNYAYHEYTHNMMPAFSELKKKIDAPKKSAQGDE
jgi:hypothetical protein